MPRSTTSAATDRRRRPLAALLIVELICALLVVGRPEAPSVPAVATSASSITPSSTSHGLRDGRTLRLVDLGGPHTERLLARIASAINDAAEAVTAFWGPEWPREIVVVAAGSDAQFAALAGGDTRTAATSTAERIMFAPGAAAMTDEALRIVLGHELFHFASRAQTAADAPRWLTEGVADFVGRPPTPPPPNAGTQASVPTDAELDGADRSSAYDRAWLFSRFVADRYGRAALRQLYLRACGHGHPDVQTAVRQTLGADMDTILTQWRQWLIR